jgi:predicted membrane metal-binding protein
MSRSVDVSGTSIVSLFYAVSLPGLVAILAVVAFPLDGIGDAALATLLVSLVLAGVVGAWRRRTGREDEHLGTAEDIAYDPSAYPGQAAKQRWLRAVRRLPDDEED